MDDEDVRQLNLVVWSCLHAGLTSKWILTEERLDGEEYRSDARAGRPTGTMPSTEDAEANLSVGIELRV